MEKSIHKLNIFFFQKREKKKESWVPSKNAKLLHLPMEWFTFISNSSKAYWPPWCYPSHCSCSTFFNLSDQRLVNKNHLCFCGEQTNCTQSYDNCKFSQNPRERNSHVLLLNSQRKKKKSLSSIWWAHLKCTRFSQ